VKKDVLVTGGTGMVGSLALGQALENPDVGRVTSIVRRASGVTHSRLREVVASDFLDYSSVRDAFQNVDVVLFCIGVYSGQVSPDEFRKITVNYTAAFADTLHAESPGATFCFLSGQGADQTETSRMMFARDKGVAENLLVAKGFRRLHIFRPGYIYPVVPRDEPNLMYRVMRGVYPALRRVVPNIGIRADDLARVMLEVGLDPTRTEDVVLENAAIRALS
jgi:uncharacterized protein YbjT (DUF2867 family)